MRKFLTKLLVAISDIAWLISLFYITTFLQENLYVFGSLESGSLKLNDFSYVILILFFLMYFENIYEFRYDFWQDTLKVLKSFVLGFLLTLSLLTLSATPLENFKAFIVIYFLMGMIFMPIMKRYTKKLMFKFGFFIQNVLILGVSDKVETMKSEVSKNWYLGQKYNEEDYKSVIIISQGLQIDKLNELIEKHIDIHSELFIVPYITNVNFLHSNILEYSNIRLNTIQIENKLLISKNIFIKNIFDKFLSSLLLPFFLLIHILVSVVIKINSTGCILFKQKRLGKDDTTFEVYKYRTMYENGSELLNEYLKENPEEIKYYQKFHKYKNDPRITKVGRFLRSTSIDELPQILNVLKGDMSLIGPRPYMLSEGEKLDKNKYFILKVKPGITGLWQVSGRNNLSFQERNELEVWYIKNWSLWADLVILVKTIKVVLGKIGAK